VGTLTGGTMTRGTVTGVTAGARGAGLVTGTTAGAVALAVAWWVAARGLGGVFRAGVEGIGVTATTLTFDPVECVAELSCARAPGDELVAVAAPTANAIANATTAAASISSKARPGTAMAYGKAGGLMLLATRRSLKVGPLITRPPGISRST
jgi:hypothetical protein